MQKITPFLWYDGNAEAAIRFYSSIFKDAKIIHEVRHGEKLFTAIFELEGQQFMALNGGPMFKFTEAVSFFVNCKNQAEIDEYWEKLTADGGEESMCGWLKDKFGLSWQIVPSNLLELLGGNGNPEKGNRAMQAMLKMRKLIIKTLEEA